MCQLRSRKLDTDELLKSVINNNNILIEVTGGEEGGFPLGHLGALDINNNNNDNNENEVEENRYETEDFIMFTVAVILFCVGSVIAVINAYCMGTRCFRVGSNRDIAHFSPCTLY